MSNYFSSFPTTIHDLKNDSQKVTLTNILKRFRTRPSADNFVNVFYDYEIQSGDRPDIIAHKYYGDSNYAWIITFFNEIHDVRFDWPLFDQDFENFIREKYGSIPAAQAQVKAYYRVKSPDRVLNDGTRILAKEFVVDQTTYNTLSESNRRLETMYDWEEEQNELKKNIRILDERYFEQVFEEVEAILEEV